nr:universal stress protein [uncultured Desulfuromonas sp.]
MNIFNRILIVSRMTPDCRTAVHCGLSLARKYHAKLQVLHLVSNPFDMKVINVPELFTEGDVKNYLNLQQEAKEELDKVLQKEIRDGFPIKVMISSQDPVEEIVKVVKVEKIDLIVMLAHEEGRIEHTLFGGEKDAITRRMPCSILLVKKEPGPVNW